ncbi:unnamed protein product, partial [Meganyctiphanes norvegica]
AYPIEEYSFDNIVHLAAAAAAHLLSSMATAAIQIIAAGYVLFLAMVTSAEHLEETPLIGNLSQVRYLLWTRENPDSFFRLLPFELENLEESPFVPERFTFLMFHGFNDNGETGWLIHSKNEFLSQFDANVISVDWSKLDPAPFYLNAVDNMYRVANLSASFIDWLNARPGFSPDRVHIIGHSLGAQAAGLTGKHIQYGTIGRITGLDPAGPAFYNKTAEHRIDSSDAAFVDIIHTNSGSIVLGCAGLFEKLGHLDFYVNGGHHQPGCEQNDNWFNDIEDVISGCSHARAWEFWLESLTAFRPDPVFAARPCSSIEAYHDGLCQNCGAEGCIDMGLYVQVPDRIAPIYVLETNKASPYALGDQ